MYLPVTHVINYHSILSISFFWNPCERSLNFKDFANKLCDFCIRSYPVPLALYISMSHLPWHVPFRYHMQYYSGIKWLPTRLKLLSPSWGTDLPVRSPHPWRSRWLSLWGLPLMLACPLPSTFRACGRRRDPVRHWHTFWWQFRWRCLLSCFSS